MAEAGKKRKKKPKKRCRVVERAGGSGASYAFPELGPREVERRMVPPDAGEWRLRCTIPTHAERGMTAALTVTG